MLKFIFKRLLEAIPTLLILITVSFFMMRLAPVTLSPVIALCLLKC